MNLVSVIIPVFQAEKFLQQCIESVLNQTYSALEILLIDDGSTDQSSNICDTYAQIDPRVNVIHKNNEGVAKARNTGLDHASGDYIMFVDSDDWIEQDMIEQMLNMLETHDADIVECGHVEWKNNKFTRRSCDNKFFILENKEDIFYHSIVNQIPYLYKVCWGKLIRRDLCNSVRFPIRSVAEDSAFCNEILFRCKKIVKIYNQYYNYRITPGSIMHSGIKPTVFESLDTVLEMRDMLNVDDYKYSSRLLKAVDEQISNTAVGIVDQIVWKGIRPADIDGFSSFYEKCQVVSKNLENPTLEFQKLAHDYRVWLKFRKEKIFLKKLISKISNVDKR